MKYSADKPTRTVTPAAGKIGVPRTLGFDELRVFFDRVLEGHGFQVVYSDRSTQKTLAKGLESCIDEVCFPLKVFFGHVAKLREDGLDTVLVPRIVSTAKGRNLCPKFHVLPDLISSAFPDLAVLAPYVDLHHSPREELFDHLKDACEPLLRELGVSSASDSVLAAAWEEERKEEPPPADDEDDRIEVAVVGHLYAERDPFLGVGVVKHLEKLGAKVIFGGTHTPKEPCHLEDGIYYEPSVRAARLVHRAIEDGVDGIVLLTYFACGPDSYSAETLSYRLKKLPRPIPTLRLIVDEQTSSEGLLTRLGTFVDVARHRREERRGGC